MSKLKITTSLKMCRLVEKEGFVAVRQNGSHRIFQHTNGCTVVIPIHPGDLRKELIYAILREIKMSQEDYNSKI